MNNRDVGLCLDKNKGKVLCKKAMLVKPLGKAKVVTLPGSYKGSPELRQQALQWMRQNEKFFNDKDY